MRQKPDLRGTQKFRALGGTDGSGAVAMRRMAPKAHLHEHGAIAVGHDQIDLAEAADEIARQRAQP